MFLLYPVRMPKAVQVSAFRNEMEYCALSTTALLGGINGNKTVHRQDNSPTPFLKTVHRQI